MGIFVLTRKTKKEDARPMTKTQMSKMHTIAGIKTKHGEWDKEASYADAVKIAPLVFQLYKEPQCDYLFDWFIKKNLIEERFLEWVMMRCGGNIHMGIRRILAELGVQRPNYIGDKK